MSSPQSLTKPKAVLWDMDGTLIDQTVGIIRCFSEVVTEMGYAKPDEATLRRSLGGPMASTMGLFVPEKTLDAACTRFRARFPEVMFDGLVILPGAMDLIRAFHAQGLPQAIFTNKHGDTARTVSEHARFSEFISVCIGNGDTSWHKPQAELTLHVLEQINAEPDGAILIGDSPTDVETALNAELTCYGVATGAHRTTELIQAGAAAAFPGLNELQRAFRL